MELTELEQIIIYILGMPIAVYLAYFANKYDNARLPISFAIVVGLASWIGVITMTGLIIVFMGIPKLKSSKRLRNFNDRFMCINNT